MKKVVLLYLFVFFNHETSSAQEIDSSIVHIDRLLLNKKEGSSQLFTYDVLDKYIYGQISKLSGTSIKDGKVASRSISVDEKSATFNYACKVNNRFFLQPTATATSEKGFVDIFSNREYQRTYTFGSNFQFFSGNNSIKYTESYAIELHNKMKYKKAFYDNFERNEKISAAQELINIYKISYDKCSTFLLKLNDTNGIDYDTLKSRELSEFNTKAEIDQIINSLIRHKIIDSSFKLKSYKQLYDTLDCCFDKHLRKVIDKGYVAYQDSLQLNANVGHGIRWISGALNYNSNFQEILSDTSQTKPSKFYNEYATLKVGYNYLLVYINKNKFYFNLNANYSSIRNFNPKKISTTNFVTNSTLGNVPVQKIDSSISYYTSIPNRANAISCDLNLAYFFFKQNFGLDFGVTAGVNDPLDNNVNARFGIYIPFTAGDKIVYVEPILKFNKLFSSAGNEFLKDNFSFGFNVSVALPDFLKPNK